MYNLSSMVKDIAWYGGEDRQGWGSWLLFYVKWSGNFPLKASMNWFLKWMNESCTNLGGDKYSSIYSCCKKVEFETDVKNNEKIIDKSQFTLKNFWKLRKVF